MVTVLSNFEAFLPFIYKFKPTTSIFQEGNGSLESKSSNRESAALDKLFQ